jgi:hypothetical protein
MFALRGVDGQIAHGDTFHNDRHPDLKADFILANPPFNISDWGGDRSRGVATSAINATVQLRGSMPKLHIAVSNEMIVQGQFGVRQPFPNRKNFDVGCRYR